MTRGGRHHDQRAERRAADGGASAMPPLEDLGGEAPPQDSPATEAAPGVSDAPVGAAPEASELKDKWLRAEADLQNFRRRAARDQGEARRSAEDAMLREWITVLDDLDRALESAGGAQVAESWLAGLRLVAQRMVDLMARYGVQPLDPAGQKFDPTFHEALAEVEGPEGVEPGTVVQVVQRGYAREGRALRPARVLVSRGSAPAGEQ